MSKNCLKNLPSHLQLHNRILIDRFGFLNYYFVLVTNFQYEQPVRDHVLSAK